jgi:hypothetical protein
LYSTAALCIADCAVAPNGVPSFISRGATTPSGAGASTSEGRKEGTVEGI